MPRRAMADEAADAMRRGLRISTRTPAGPPRSLDVVCKFFLRGFCANGDACRFLHPSPEDARAPPPPSFAAPAAADFISAADAGAAGAGAVPGAPAGRHSGGSGTSAPMRVPQATRTEEREYVDFATAYASVFRPSSLESGAGSAASPSYLSSLAEEKSRTYSRVAGAGVDGAGEGTAHRTGAPRSMRPARTIASGAAPAAASTAAVAAAVLCKFHADGNCRYGAGCMYTHGTFCSLCQKNVLHPTENALAAAHVRACAEKAERHAHTSPGAAVECGICMENPAALGRKFGLLQNCDHPFCLECVRSWRGSDNAEVFGRENVRSCPLCRVESFVIIPSETFETDVDEKDRLLESYRRKLGRIPCKHFRFGDGTCPFGTRCMYAHVDRDGREQANPDLVFNDTGSSVKKSATLLDYL